MEDGEVGGGGGRGRDEQDKKYQQLQMFCAVLRIRIGTYVVGPPGFGSGSFIICRQDFVQIFCCWKTDKYCLDPEPEPKPEPEPEPKLFRSRTQNQNFSKVGTGTGTNHYSSTTLL